MKYFKFLFLLFVAAGCQKVWTVEQIIKNNTKHDIKIETFYNGQEQALVSIGGNESHSQTRIMEPRNTDQIFIFQSLIDSVNIKFDNERIIIQSCSNSDLMSCPNIERNILRLPSEYKEENTGKRSIRYTYTLTEEDYNKAIPIE